MQLCELEVELYELEADLCVLAEVLFQSEVRYYELVVGLCGLVQVLCE